MTLDSKTTRASRGNNVNSSQFVGWLYVTILAIHHELMDLGGDDMV